MARRAQSTWLRRGSARTDPGFVPRVSRPVGAARAGRYAVRTWRARRVVEVRLRVVLAVLVALTVLAGIGIYLGVRALSDGLPIQLPIQQCVVTANGTATLDPEQMANAATIAAVGIRRGVPDHAVTIALATA